MTAGAAILAAATLSILCAPLALGAQNPEQPQPTLEAGYGEARLSAGYPAWRQAYGRVIIAADRVVYQFEGVQRSAFGDAGSYAAASATRVLNADWYGSLTAGLGSGSFLFPRTNAGGMIARKWGERRAFVTTSALNYYAQTDRHRDVVWTGSVLYYSARPAVWQAGFTVARSNPGRATGYAPFLVAQLGDPRRRIVTLRVSGGREAYSRLGRDTALVAFGSHNVLLGWRASVARNLGYVLEAEHYGTALYSRTGLKLGAFWGPAR